MDFLKRLIGGKTKFFSNSAAALTVAYQLGLVHLTPEQYAAAMALLGAGVMHGVRDAIAKSKS